MLYRIEQGLQLMTAAFLVRDIKNCLHRTREGGADSFQRRLKLFQAAGDVSVLVGVIAATGSPASRLWK